MDASEFVEIVTNDDAEAVCTALRADRSLVDGRAWAIQTTALHAASHRGSAPIVELLLGAGADVHSREGASNTTPLHWAAEGGHVEVARMLVERGADLEPVDDWYELAPLGWASVVRWAPAFHKDKPATAAYLHKAGAKLDIFSAVALNRGEMVRPMVMAEPSLLSRRLGFAAAGMQPLHLAVSRKLEDMIKLLLDLGADLQARTASGVTPLSLAVSRRDPGIVALLRDRGAVGDISTAVLSGEIGAMQSVLERESVDPALLTKLLFVAARSDKPEICDLLLRHGADPNARTKYLIQELPALATSLHLAALHGASGSARTLLAHGADPNPKSEDGAPSPLHLAAGNGHLDTVRTLLQEGSDKTGTDAAFGATPQGWAEFNGHAEIARLLAEA